jgi:hypothetical protein
MMADEPTPTDNDGRKLDDTVELAPVTDNDEDLMTRCEVASRFRVHSATVKNWARSNAVALTAVHDDQGKPRYRRSEVQAL